MVYHEYHHVTGHLSTNTGKDLKKQKLCVSIMEYNSGKQVKALLSWKFESLWQQLEGYCSFSIRGGYKGIICKISILDQFTITLEPIQTPNDAQPKYPSNSLIFSFLVFFIFWIRWNETAFIIKHIKCGNTRVDLVWYPGDLVRNNSWKRADHTVSNSR